MIVVPSAQETLSASDVFGRSWLLLRRHPMIVWIMLAFLVALLLIVTAAAGGIGVTVFLHARGHRGELPPADVWLICASIAVAWLGIFAINIAYYAALYGLADAAWSRDAVTPADARNAVRTRWFALFQAALGFLGLGILALMLALPTLGLAILALPLVTMYVFPAAVAGGRDGFSAFAESWRLVRKFFGTSALALLMIFAIQNGVSFVALPFLLPLQFTFMTSAASTSGTPLTFPFPPVWEIVLAGVGYVVLLGVSVVILGYAALVQTGLYRVLRAREDAAAATGVV